MFICWKFWLTTIDNLQPVPAWVCWPAIKTVWIVPTWVELNEKQVQGVQEEPNKHTVWEEWCAVMFHETAQLFPQFLYSLGKRTVSQRIISIYPQISLTCWFIKKPMPVVPLEAADFMKHHDCMPRVDLTHTQGDLSFIKSYHIVSF